MNPQKNQTGNNQNIGNQQGKAGSQGAHQSLAELLEHSELFKHMTAKDAAEMKKRILSLPDGKKQQATRILLEEKAELGRLEQEEQNRTAKIVDEYLIKIQKVKKDYTRQIRQKKEQQEVSQDEIAEQKLLNKLTETDNENK